MAKTLTTKHSAICKMSFGKAKPETGCPRCVELANGAAPRQWSIRQAFNATAPHYRHNCVISHCGPVCTFGDW